MEKFEKVEYKKLNPKQKENYNFHKAASILANYGFNSIRLNDDWEGADFIAINVNNKILRIQLKGRFCFYKKYEKKDLWIAFFDKKRDFYPYCHDELLEQAKSKKLDFLQTVSWKIKGDYRFRSISKDFKEMLKPYKIE